MNQITAFERLIADVADDVMGPSRPVDAAWIVQSARTTAPPSRWTELVQRLQGGRTAVPEGGFSVFSAVKLVAAAAIVALFGGLLLTGVLMTQQGEEVAPAAVTESPSAMTTQELLSGMTTEEVEPGVYRVVHDGHHDLTFDHHLDLDTQIGIVAGHDGGIWFALKDSFFRLGAEETYELPADRRLEGRFFDVAPDGTVWTIETAGEHEQESKDVAALRSYDGEKWTVHKRRPVDFDIAPDGTVWAAWQGSGNDTVVGYLADDGWKRLPGTVKYGDGLSISHEGEVWVSQWYEPYLKQSDLPHPDAKTTGPAAGQQAVLFRYADNAWENVIGPHADVRGGFGFGTDRVLRVDTADGRQLYFEDGQWHEWQLPSRQPAWEEGGPAWGTWDDDGYKVAPDGSLWADWSLPNPDPDPWKVGSPRCDGVARFVGDSLERYLSGHCFERAAIGSDGSVWLLGNEAGWTLEGDATDSADRPVKTYVITPDAAAATE